MSLPFTDSPPSVRHAPVTPIRVGRLAAASVALSAVVSFGVLLLVVPLRRDLMQLGKVEAFSLSGLELLAAGVLLMLGARQLVPGRLTPRFAVATVGGLALACTVAVGVRTALLSAIAPPAEEAVAAAVLCLFVILLLSLPYAVALSRLVAVGFTSRRRWAVVFVGLAAGLACNAVWRLFCPYTDRAHQLWGHGGGVVCVVVAGVALLYWADRRSSLIEK